MLVDESGGICASENIEHLNEQEFARNNMATHHKAEAIAKIRGDGIIPLFFHPDPVTCRSVAQAVFQSGCNSIEFTNRGEGALNAFASIVEHARSNHPGALVGAGSINDAHTAAQFLSLGADFIVGPGFDEGVAQLCNRQRILYIPGCATVTEILTASKHEAELIKLFPADALGGPGFVKALKGPLPWLKAVATGGVRATEESMNEWYSAGTEVLGLGSDLISRDVLARSDYIGLQQQLAALLLVARRLRGSRNSSE
jgi:2-dehydro-3-deoxyphosphogluconate aldolase / (4S)-4-hydroxy-2-oxoglutarate aldolase